MKRYALVASAVVAIAVALTAPALSEGDSQSTPTITQTDPCLSHPYPATEQRHLAHRAFAVKRWRDPTPAKPAELRLMRRLRGCAAPHLRAQMSHAWRAAKRPFYRYRTYRKVAPYAGGGQFWAVPYKIVLCESGASWTASNSSGAEGPYQLLGHGQPWPVTSWHDKMMHHRIARSLYESSGTGPWVSSQSCWG